MKSSHISRVIVCGGRQCDEGTLQTRCFTSDVCWQLRDGTRQWEELEEGELLRPRGSAEMFVLPNMDEDPTGNKSFFLRSILLKNYQETVISQKSFQVSKILPYPCFWAVVLIPRF